MSAVSGANGNAAQNMAMNPNCRHSSRYSSMMGGCRGSFSCSFASSQMNAVSCRVTSCRGRARSLCALVRNRDSRHDVSTPRGRLSSARRLDLTRWCPPGRRECTLFDRQQQQLVVFRQHVAQQRAQQRAQRHVSTSSSHVRSAVLLMYTSTSTRPCCLTVEMSWPVMNTKPKCDPSLVTLRSTNKMYSRDEKEFTN